MVAAKVKQRREKHIKRDFRESQAEARKARKILDFRAHEAQPRKARKIRAFGAPKITWGTFFASKTALNTVFL